MPAVTSVPSSGDTDINGLLTEVKWAVSSFTFSFPTSASFYGGAGYSSDNEPANNFEALNSVQRSVVRAVLDNYASVAAVTFSELTESDTVHADLRLAESNDPSTAWGYYPSTADSGGDSWYNNTGNKYDNPVKGNYAYHTFTHELGHNMGLEHGHDAISDGDAMTAAHDSMEYSVMTYRSYTGQSIGGGYTNGTASYAQSLMMYDIAALQYMYGPNYASNAGDTTYSWSATTGELSINSAAQGVPAGNRVFMTLWDGGGIDTYDFSNYTTAVTADLAPGAWTTMSQAQRANLGNGHFAAGNVANALLYQGDLHSIIENVSGGSGADTLFGNEAANLIRGNGGNDTFYGGSGADVLIGGTGLDTARSSGARSAYTVLQSGAIVTVAGLESADTLSGIERIQFSDLAMDLVVYPGMTVIDYNGDGNADVLLRNAVTGQVQEYRMNGLSVGAQGVIDVPTAGSAIVGHRDYNGDGMTDVLVQNAATRQIWEYQMNGLSVVAQGLVDTPSGAWSVVENADYNGDAKSDVLLQHATTHQIWQYQMNGLGIAAQGLVDSPSAAWRVAGSADYNGDGKSDILLQHATTHQIWQYQMNGLGIAAQGLVDSPSAAWNVVGSADYNGDGKSDILLQHDTTGQIWEYQMNGLGIAAQGLVGSPGTSWKVVGNGDYNGDGKSDVLLMNEVLGEIREYQMNGLGIAAQGVVDRPTGPWHVVGNDDYNGDGRSDVLMQNASTGQVWEYQMNGLAIYAQALIASPTTDWSVVV